MKTLSQHITESFNEDNNNSNEVIVEKLEDKVDEGQETIAENEDTEES